MVELIIVGTLILITLYTWVRGASRLKSTPPDYQEKELFNWSARQKEWDDDKTHTEGGI